MSDAAQFFLALAAITLAFGTVWVRPGGVLFVSRGGPRHAPRWVARHAAARNDRGGLLLANLVPFGDSFVAAPWPVSVSPGGVVAHAPSAPTPDGRADGSGAFAAFADLPKLATDGKVLLLAGRPFVTCASKSAASRWARWLAELKALPEAERDGWVRRALAASLDPAAAAEAYARCRRTTRGLRAASTVLFGYAFLALGLAAFADLAARLEYALPGYVVLVVVVFVLYRRAARRVGPPDGPSVGHGWVLLVSPADAFRASDAVFRPAMELFHPLAAARAAAGHAAAADLARQAALDLAHPLPAVPLADPRAADAVAWFAARLRWAVVASLRDAGIDPARYSTPPVPDGPDVVGYCPRCHGQFMRTAGPCSGCGVEVWPFTGDTPPTGVFDPGPPLPAAPAVLAPVVAGPTPEPDVVPASSPKGKLLPTKLKKGGPPPPKKRKKGKGR